MLIVLFITTAVIFYIEHNNEELRRHIQTNNKIFSRKLKTRSDSFCKDLVSQLIIVSLKSALLAL